jgi:hypothetical protein
VTWAALLLFVGTRVASGFKGALIEVLTVLVIARATAPGGLGIAAAVRRYLVPLVAAALFAGVVLQLYATSTASSQSAPAALVARATVGTAAAGVLSLERGRELLPATTVLANDVGYVAWKYAGVGDEPRFAYSQLVSARQYRTALRSDSFIVPVTIGTLPVLVHDLPLRWALAAMALVGAAYAYVQRAATAAVRWQGYLPCAAGLLLLHSALTKGDLVYGLVNWGVMAVFTWLLVRLGHRRAPSTSGAGDRPPAAVGAHLPLPAPGTSP